MQTITTQQLNEFSHNIISLLKSKDSDITRTQLFKEINDTLNNTLNKNKQKKPLNKYQQFVKDTINTLDKNEFPTWKERIKKCAQLWNSHK